MRRRAFLALAAAALAAPARAGGEGAYRFAFESIDGGPLPLSDFAGRVLLVVNTASRCMYTRQYDDLQALWTRYRDHGLVVLGVPSDDFGGQELDDEAAVKDFCETNFAVDFPMTTITHVRGGSAHPFYLWAKETLGRGNAPGWNFHKYLVGPDGALIRAFDSNVSPNHPKLIRAVEAALPAA